MSHFTARDFFLRHKTTQTERRGETDKMFGATVWRQKALGKLKQRTAMS
jgi:hypothetical protein